MTRIIVNAVPLTLLLAGMIWLGFWCAAETVRIRETSGNRYHGLDAISCVQDPQSTNRQK